MVDTRFWVTKEAEEEAEEMTSTVMKYIKDHQAEYDTLSEEEMDKLYDNLWNNFKTPGIMEMSIEEVLNL